MILQTTQYEAIVVGAGPAGSYAARCLSELGHDVALVDENEGPRCTVICSGIVGREAFEILPLPKHAVIDTIRRAHFVSPSGMTVEYAPRDPLAYVVDRTRFDGALAAEAVEAGAVLFPGCTARHIEKSDVAVTVTVRRNGRDRVLRARALVVATGYQRPLHQTVGLGAPRRYVHGIHAEVPFGDLNGAELYFGTGVSRGFFAWAVPFGNGVARLGILSDRNGRDLFKRFVGQLAIESRMSDDETLRESGSPRFHSRAIVQDFVHPSFADRTLAVGEAAGQVKTTTGGGIYYGAIGAQIAADILSRALRRNRLGAEHLRRYEEAWHDRLGPEIRAGLELQRIGRAMDNPSIDKLFEACQNGLGTAIRQAVRFDWHRPALRLLFEKTRRRLGR
ncbi:geranylgeranyl reductase family protein [soil metagenome]